MGMLKNPRAEVFAQELAKGKTKTEAARAAGLSETSASAQGCRMSNRPDVQARVKELQDRGASLSVAAVGVSKQWVLAKLAFVVESNEGKPAGVKALELIGRELGMFQQMIPIEQFHVLMFRMGEAVASLITDPEVLDAIAKKWEAIQVSNPLLRNVTPPAVENAVEPGPTPSESESE